MSATCQCSSGSKPWKVFGQGDSVLAKVKNNQHRKKLKQTCWNEASSVSFKIYSMTSIGSALRGSPVT